MILTILKMLDLFLYGILYLLIFNDHIEFEGQVMEPFLLEPKTEPFPYIKQEHLANYTRPKTLFSIHIHTSKKTVHRLYQFFMKYKKEYPFIKYYAVVGKNVIKSIPGIDLIESDCADRDEGTTGLFCRDIASYNHFLNHPEDGQWLYRAMDDTILHIDNLLKLINKLNIIYDASKDVAFRGCQNHLGPNEWYLGSGSGWLSSREMIRLHSKPKFSFSKNFDKLDGKAFNTYETLIVQKAFDEIEMWNDQRWIESCQNCDADKIINQNFDEIKNCEEGIEVYPFDEIVSFNTHQKIKNEQMINLMLKENMSTGLYYYKPHANKGIVTFCINPKKIGSKNSFEYMKNHSKNVGVEELVRNN